MSIPGNEITTFLEMLDSIVNADSSWNDKKEQIKEYMSNEDFTNLSEFLSWFEEDD